MTIVKSGKNWKGEECEFYLDENLFKNLEEIKRVVTGGDWDYVCLVSGNPGVGKSNFAISCAKFLCENFNEKYICFSAQEFIDLTSTCPKNSAVILDESFASLNAKVSMSSDFIRIINHLQLIRQKNLFIFLVLPNFFDLAKGVAIYRAHHLFVVYGEKFGDRGRFAAFSRDNKRLLYINGQKFMNYNAQKPNFRGKFVKQKVIDKEVYEKLKSEHLKKQGEIQTKKSKYQMQRDKLIKFCNENKLSKDDLMNVTGLQRNQINKIIRDTE